MSELFLFCFLSIVKQLSPRANTCSSNPLTDYHPLLFFMCLYIYSKVAQTLLTFPEVIEMREKHFCVVHGGEPEEVVLAHLAQLFPVSVLKHGRVDLQQAILLDGPLEPLTHVVLGP